MVKRQYWLLGGGLSLAAGLWLMDGLTHTLVQVGELTFTGAAALLGVWWLYQRSTRTANPGIPDPGLTRAQVDQTLHQTQQMLDALSQELQPDLSHHVPLQAQALTLQTQKNHLSLDCDRPQLRLAVVGGTAVGKSTLIQGLQQRWTGTPTLDCQEQTLALGQDPQYWQQFDLILFVTPGDLTESDRQWLQGLRHGVGGSTDPQSSLPSPALVVALNKLDHYSPGQQATLLTQLCHRLQGWVDPVNIVPIAAAPDPIQVRRQSSDGTWHQSQEQPDPALSPLIDRLGDLLQGDPGQQLLWGTSYRLAQGLQRSAHTALNQVRRDRAMALIDRYQWLAAGAAFLNPVPSVDLLAALALNGQLILELSRLYHKPLALHQGQELAATLGELLVKLGLVEISTQALASVLKTNGLTFWAGAGLQGVSAAYLTRMAGLSLVEYFQSLEGEAEATTPAIVERLRPILHQVFSLHGQTERLQAFGQTAVAHLKGLQPQAKSPLLY
ncbi:DUF697 domain-containing protein [Prochlorothrix hollandica]|uniref:G domain-containing protein n=1 Tax=Prochlorothrix hollandica PCC 9006 = CALU 1027 TaxID=317619 RepID=A0A0M2PRP4_PROHO|nr:DUF697 domain-containing protein [Prochlorothrix hollandica]KKI99205.1 hypothetical protein PROH_15750 [Prochlorothrix hollandica PCC 9006 = CALU 1027]